MADSGSQWHDAFPTPPFDTPRISPEALAQLVLTKVAGVDYIVVDVRRTDFENLYIRKVINLPAHSFYPTLGTISTLLCNIPDVIFHCNSCTQTGRGPRTAGWYALYLQKLGITTSKAWVLDGGIKQFGNLYGNDDRLVSKL